MEWYIYVLRKYAVFSGRARRKEYWNFILINFFICILISLLTLLPNTEKITGIVSICYSLVVLIPGFAVCVRRLHDTNRSGYSLFLLLIPLVGLIIITIYLTQDGDTEKNKFGTNSKNEDENTLIKDSKKQNKWLIPLIIVLSVTMLILFFYFGFKNIGSKEQFGIFNMSNNNYYLNVISNTSISQYSLKRYIEINGVNYYFIIKSGRYKLRGARNIFQCERKKEINIDIKLKDIFYELNIVDEHNNIIWDLYDGSFEEITRIEHPHGTIFWILSMK